MVWQHAREYNLANHQRSLLYPSRYPLVWELELLVRELVLNGLPTGDANQMSDMGLKAIDHIRRITEAVSKAHIHCAEDAVTSSMPLLHQQQPWMEDSCATINRYIRIMRHTALAEVMERELHISLHDLVKLGFTVAGGLYDAPIVSKNVYSLTPDIASGAADAFFKLTTSEICVLRESIRAKQHYDRRWAYTYNPLRGTPLIYRKEMPDTLHGPIPQLVLWRITEGLYYDLLGKPGFSEALGDAYQRYIGEVLDDLLPSSMFTVQRETPYEIKKGQVRHGADWRISDTTGHFFVECKAKRLTLLAKARGEGQELDNDLEHLARFVVQNYKNINDALTKRVPDFELKGLPVYSVVTTLEDWRLDLPHLKAHVDKLVRQEAANQKLRLALLDECPYEVMSTAQFERRCQEVARRGIAGAFGSEAAGPAGLYKTLFPGALAELLPEIAESAGLNRFSG